MPFKDFDELIEQLFELCKLPGADLVTHSALLEMDGVMFIVQDSSNETENAFEYHCDFGELPKSRRDDVMARLLELNNIVPMEDAQKFSIDTETGHVFLSCRLKVGGITALDVLNAFAEHAAQAKIWRETFYLKEHDAQRANPKRTSLERRMARTTADE